MVFFVMGDGSLTSGLGMTQAQSSRRLAEVGTGTSRDGQGKRPSWAAANVSLFPSQPAIERPSLAMSALRILVPVKRVIDYAVSARPGATARPINSNQRPQLVEPGCP